MQETHVLDTLKVNSYVASMDHDVFIDETIEDEAYYRSVISTLNKATERDTVRFTISSNGGFGSTAMVLAHAMDTCPARKIGILSGNVKSAATIIALHCDDWQIGAGCDWMAHTASFGLSGSANSVQKYHDHEQKMIRRLLEREYTGFYTEEEIEDIAKGNDSLLMPEEVQERLQNFAEHRQQQQESSLEDLFSSQNEEAEKMEQVLLNKLLEDGKISQEELDIAKRVQRATLELDESLDDEQFNQLMKAGIPPESLDAEPEDKSLCKFEVSQGLCFLREDVDMNIWEVSNNGKFYILNKDDELYEHEISEEGFHGYTIGDLKKLCDSFNIKYANNVKNKKILIERLIEDAEKFWKEYAS